MDKKWESRLIPVLPDAVELVANLLSPESSFWDKLVQKRLLTDDQAQDIYSEAEKRKKVAARNLFTALKRRPAPSFDRFCDVLTEVDQGEDLRNLLTTGLCQSDRSDTAVDSQSSSESIVAAKVLRQLAPQHSDVTAEEAQSRLDPEEEARRGYQEASMAAGRVKEARSVQPANAAETDSDSDSDSDSGKERPTILSVSVLREHENVYKRHKHSFRSVIKRVFLKVYQQRVKVDEVYPKKLYRSSDPANFNFSVTETVAFRIVFPKLKNRELFEPHRLRIVREFAGVTGIHEDRVEIFAIDGSCILLITIPGDGFIRFVAALGVPGRLDFLYAVDADVIVKIDGLFEIPLKTLHGTQDEQVLKFPNGDDDSQHFPKENPVLSDEGWSSGEDSCEAPYGTTEGVLESLNRDREKHFQKKKEIAEDKIETSKSRPETASDEAVQADSTIASAISISFISCAKRNKHLLIRMGEVSDQIMEIMQQSEGFTPDQVNDIINERQSEKRGRSLLQHVDKANDRVKTSFAFALFAVAPQLINDVAPDLYNKVSRKATEEYLTVGGGRVQKNAFKRRLEAFLLSVKKQGNSFAIVTLGRPGVGKSTLINCLIGSNKIVSEKECTLTSTAYDLPGMNDLPIKMKIWNTPGLQDDIEGSVKKIAEQVKGKVNLLVFCIDITNPRNEQELLKMISTVSISFKEGRDIWKSSMFVLTKANLLRAAASDSDDLEHFRTAVANLTDGCKKLLKQKEYKIPPDVVDKIPFVPVGSHRDKLLPNGEPWFPEFWTAAIERATDAGKALLLLMNENRLSKGGDGLELNDAQKKRLLAVVKPVLSPTAAVVLAVTSVGVGAIIGGIAGLAFGPPGIAVGAGVGAFVGGLFGFGVGKKLS